jgi:hypothetical protein
MKRMCILLFTLLSLVTFNFETNAERLKEIEGKEIKLNLVQWKKLNTYFSNFSEVFFEPFSEGQLSNEEIIRFGVSHNIRNNESLIENVDENHGRLAAKYVEASVEKYFGIKHIDHKSVPGYRFKNGYYIVSWGSGEAYCFSQVTKLIDIGDDCFIAYTNEYVASSGFTGDPNGSAKDWEKDEETLPELTDKMRSIIKRIKNKNSTRYILMEYKSLN